MTISIIEIFEVAGLIVMTATAIAKLTPSSKDDGWVEKARKFLENLSNMFLPDLKK